MYMNQLQVGDIFSKALSVYNLKEKKTGILLKLNLIVITASLVCSVGILRYVKMLCKI